MIDHLQKLGFNATAEHLFNKTAKDRFPEKNWRVDIVVEIRNNYYEIELKFDNEQNAKNKVKRFINAFWRNVYKLENVIRDNKEIVRGLAIIMSNDKFHNEDRTNALTPKNGTPKQIIYNGYRIRLKGKYKPHWHTTNSSYEYCMIEVK